VALNALSELVSNQGDWPTAWATMEESIAISRNLNDHRGLARGLATLSLFRVRGAGGAGQDSQPLADESLALARSLGEPWTLGYVLTVLDSRNVLLGNHQSGPRMSEEALHWFEKAGDQWGVIMSLRHIGMGAMARGDYSAARKAAEKALAVSREIGARLDEAYTLSTLADLARIEGDYELANGYYEQGLALYRNLGLKGDVASTLHGLGHVALARGRAPEALNLQTQSLEMQRAAGNKAGMLEGITGLAAVARVLGDRSRAARLLGAVEALRTALDAPIWPAEQVEYDRHVTALRADLDDTVFADAWAEGRAMTLEQATAEALAPMRVGGSATAAGKERDV
jgi:tetratricopeptide (TPR) repeat protein